MTCENLYKAMGEILAKYNDISNQEISQYLSLAPIGCLVYASISI